MALSFIRFLAFGLLLVGTTQAKGIFDSLRSDYQSVVPECTPQYYPPRNTDLFIPTPTERPPANSQLDVSAPKMIIVPYLQRYVRTFEAPILETVHIQREIPF